eukprot:9947931-Alexandrium_andersonii.AAC.1
MESRPLLNFSQPVVQSRSCFNAPPPMSTWPTCQSLAPAWLSSVSLVKNHQPSKCLKRSEWVEP